MGLIKPKNVVSPNTGGGGMEMVLLWENASPASTFAPQTISIDLTPFDFVVIEANRYYTTKNMYFSFISKFGVSTLPWAGTSGQGVAAEYRQAVWNENSNGIVFDAGYDTYGTTKEMQNNGAAIPVKIYGVKGVSA